MASKSSAPAALFLALNLLFFSLVSAKQSYYGYGSGPIPPGFNSPGFSPPAFSPPGFSPPGFNPPVTPGPGGPSTPGSGPNTPGSPTTPTPTPASRGRCPRDVLKFGVCANVLGLVRVVVGSPPTLPCCSLIQGLVDLEAAICLCTAIRANILGLVLNIPISLSLLLNVCGRRVPTGFQC